MSEPTRRPLHALEIDDWAAIVTAIVGTNQITAIPLRPGLADGYFSSALLKWPGQWRRKVVVIFPYVDEAWIQRAREVLAFEATAWQRWCDLQETLATNGGTFCAPVWW